MKPRDIRFIGEGALTSEAIDSLEKAWETFAGVNAPLLVLDKGVKLNVFNTDGPQCPER